MRILNAENLALQDDPVILPLNESVKPMQRTLSKVSESLRQVRQRKVNTQDISWLWIKMTQAFGHKFIVNYGEKDEGVWYETLKGLTTSQLTYGFKKLLKSFSVIEKQQKIVWPPNAKEFRLYCEDQLADFQLPNVHRAFYEMERNRWLSRPFWTHPLISLAAQQMGQDSESHRGILFARFKRSYEALVQEFMQKECLNLIQNNHDD